MLSAGAAAAAPAVVQGDLNMRSGPGTSYRVVSVIPEGTTVDVRGCTGSWCRVSYGGRAGYASANYLGGGGVAESSVPVPGPYAAYDDGYYDDYAYGSGPYYDDYYGAPIVGLGVGSYYWRGGHRYWRGRHHRPGRWAGTGGNWRHSRGGVGTPSRVGTPHVGSGRFGPGAARFGMGGGASVGRSGGSPHVSSGRFGPGASSFGIRGGGGMRAGSGGGRVGGGGGGGHHR
jgi:hypothetical protein